MSFAAAAIATVSSRADAVADRYEATLSLRPVGAMARVAEDVGANGGSVAVPSRGGGGELGLSVGIRHWLDLEADAVGAGFSTVTYENATVAITGTPAMGRLVRTTRIAQLRAGATLRLGARWVPTVHLAVGAGARVLTAADLHNVATGRPIDLTPDGMAAGMPLDVLAVVRLGFEHRLDTHWSAGVSADAIYAVGLQTAPLEVVSAGLYVAYSWYPNRW